MKLATSEQDPVRQYARPLAVAPERADGVEQVALIALPGARRAAMAEAFVGMVIGADARACIHRPYAAACLW